MSDLNSGRTPHILFTQSDLFLSIPTRSQSEAHDPYMGNSSVTHVTFFQFLYFHWATIKYLVDQSNKSKAYDDLEVQFYITT